MPFTPYQPTNQDSPTNFTPYSPNSAPAPAGSSPLPFQNLDKPTASGVFNMLPGSQLLRDVGNSASAIYQGAKGGIQKLLGYDQGAQSSFQKSNQAADQINPTKDFGSGANLALTAATPLIGGGGALATIGKSAALGAGFGAAQSTAEGKPFSDVALNTALGGVAGGALGAAGKFIGEAASLAKNGDVAKSSSIMNRVARLTPTDANKFSELAGMSHGEYLARSGNFGTPEQIIQNESKKFVNSLDQVDSAIAKLPGVYKSDPVTSALDELAAREKVVSTPGAESPDFARINQLVKANEKDGLTMDQINQVKRLYERNIKLQFAKDITGQSSEKIARATNIDNAMRNWQFNQAENLGLKNLPELNKQTQMSKAIINSLGKQITGKTGNNALSLTDWIMLSHGNPESIAGFLTKKTFSSPAVQSGVAKLLAKSPTLLEKAAQLEPTAENAFRKVSPTGAKLLPAPKEGTPRVSLNSLRTLQVSPSSSSLETTGKSDLISNGYKTPPTSTPPMNSQVKKFYLRVAKKQ